MKENLERPLFLGLDTSAYTTSLALVDGDERLVVDSRMPLPVKESSLGLRQSEAVFAHISNMPRLWENDAGVFRGSSITAIASSVRPRPVESSYMPVFKVCEAFGLFLAQALGLFFLPSSHQEGHIMAGIWSAGLPRDRYLVLHLSGGTTEIIASDEESPGKLKLNLLGGSIDLNAGQFVDRLGLAMGFQFPAGPQLEVLAGCCQTEVPTLPLAVKGSEISFSGPASHAERLLQQGGSKAGLARAIEICIADSLAAAVNCLLRDEDEYKGVLGVGGVMANLFIRERLKEKIAGLKLSFAQPRYAADNAVGLAVQAARFYQNMESR